MSMGCGKRKLMCQHCGKYTKHWQHDDRWHCVNAQWPEHMTWEQWKAAKR